ncbi:lytic murein transglycosylase [Limnobaculum xujianqingii]|uniref:lytic murein transglycosylase n=1 Tax=Limnobaculum xujianqingii TaxID=2738837 RepID=UPI001E506514|nr:lytic murein transglycosylase [Limnobaculum xujianqingii]
MKLSMIARLTGVALLAGCSGKNLQAQPVINNTATSAPTAEQSTAYNESQFPAYVEKLKARALSEGISQQTIDQAFANVYFLSRVIDSDKNQLEKKITLDDYLQRVLPDWKIDRARQMYQANKSKLNKASKRSGVPASYIVALWGMESTFGKRQGKEDIISALATLAFEGRREEFFTKQLIAALQILQQGHIQADKFKGSWAGAMGQCQFMPTSFLKYGLDGNGDGRIDIWNDKDDVFASTANYLATEGWNPNEGWGQEVKLTKALTDAAIGLEDAKAKSVAEWQKQGIVLSHKVPGKQQAWIIQPDDAQGRTFMVFNNFRTIMHWNRSTYFAISIGTLADKVVQN